MEYSNSLGEELVANMMRKKRDQEATALGADPSLVDNIEDFYTANLYAITQLRRSVDNPWHTSYDWRLAGAVVLARKGYVIFPIPQGEF